MPRYSIKANGKTVVFRASNKYEARRVAFRMDRCYSNFKRLESRWWLMVFPGLFVLGLIGVSTL